MLSIKPASFSSLFSRHIRPPAMVVVTALVTMHNFPVHADSNTELEASANISSYASPADYSEYYRQEPIVPIPLDIEVNQPKAALGESLFFDTRLSSNRQVACISCHKIDTGGDDGLVVGISSSAERHIINTPTIFNSLFNFRQNWSGSVRSLNEQIERSIRSKHAFNNNWDDIVTLLSEDTKLVSEFNQVYAEGLNKSNIIDAIVEFEKTLITPNSPFDRYLRKEENSLTEVEIEGYRTFKELGCISCHQGINVGGNLFQKFGVFYDYLSERGDIKRPDYGRMNITKRQMDEFVFKVPSLRNIELTAPYLHDGSAETLEEVIIIMGKTQLGRVLSNEEVALIEAFLRTLTGEYKYRPLGTDSWETPSPNSSEVSLTRGDQS